MNMYQQIAKRLENRTILYIDDEPGVLATLREVLMMLCPKVLEATNAKNGMTLYLQHHPDIIILDIQLPGTNGIEMARLIREQDRHTRIILLSAFTDSQYTLQAVELGITRYLVKPVTSGDLIPALEKCIDELEEQPKEPSAQIVLAPNVSFDPSSGMILRGDETIKLTKKEWRLLQLLLDHRERVVPYEVIEQRVWPDIPPTSLAIRSQVKNLRKKLGVDLIVNISGVGYRLEAEA